MLLLTTCRCEVLIRFIKGSKSDEVAIREPKLYNVPHVTRNVTPLSVLVRYLAIRGVESELLLSPRSAGSGCVSRRLKVLLAFFGNASLWDVATLLIA